ncbi:hypothetical protein [Desulfoscipio geothermicus]|uniref:Uncharacterized protein n=1 Tax=Desulfoscipio geothermicus DSM 3669 TaxID=1121426 RepID=A0A1I6EMR7_9FIRM|nr:hypothetical protein [Desulfoscipio geothermicus]SFR18871.1 hypothetical protein SAMN05660706_1722 [Desulfoscipio geothermicus DSM 3669]
MKRKIVCALCTLLLIAIITVTPVMAAQTESKPAKAPEVMYLTPEKNPADPQQIEEIREDVKNGNVMTAKLKTDAQIEGVDFTTVKTFYFDDVRELKSQTFSISENDVSIEARAWDNDGNESGYYTITLYRDKAFDEKIGTAIYRYSPEKRTYYNIWFDVGPGNYYFVIQCSDNYLDGDGKVLQRL